MEKKELSLEDQELAMYENALTDETLKAIEDALDAVEKEKEEEKNKTAETIFLEYIKKVNTKQEKLVATKKVRLSPPEGISKEEMAEILKDISTNKAFSHIGIIVLSKDTYLYDKNCMTEHFAQIEALIEDKDILKVIAETARRDCRIYPRPLKMSSLRLAPFYYTEDEILGALARMKGIEEYNDIDVVSASNGHMCIYSKQYLSEKYARSLAEYIEVERLRDV
ncbi:MAG: hypothetical protein MR210_03390 [Erysipelotrichaceae bacterium]|nr:hypothetical protein [Erysipelotrichaceae bacterium]MDY5251153.1 hypothetical protein [Erysipelotrichaceae bacterium]